MFLDQMQEVSPKYAFPGEISMAHLVCQSCKSTYAEDEARWRCDCGSLLDLKFTPIFDLGKIAKRPPGMWRYREAIPIKKDEDIVSFDEGFSPLSLVQLDGQNVYLKQDHLFPSGSYKDRGASVLISKVKELGLKKVVEDSSGNAGCAVAAYSARAGIDCEIYVPENTSPGKLAQIQIYGAHLVLVPGSREDTAHAVMQAAQNTYYASHSWNPFFFQGTKTFAFEVCEQLGWNAPDVVVLPVGNGTLLLGAYLGFRELLTAGIIDCLPRIIAVQSQNCAPLYRAFHEGLSEVPAVEKRDTLAEGIAIAEPVRGQQILAAVLNSQGTFLAVSEHEIAAALILMAHMGFYIEPTAAATIAGLRRYLNDHSVDDVILSVLTGHGLKSTEKLMKMIKGEGVYS
jgi:threonine synthase